MPATDTLVLAVLEVVLILFTIYASYRDRHAQLRNVESGFAAEVTRGDASMAALHTVYGAAVGSCLILLNNTTAFEGHKVLLVVVDFVALTYLFYLNTWFRNSVFFPLRNRVRRD